MTEAIFIGVGGAWKGVGALWVGVGGVSKAVANVWVGVGGVWKQTFAAFAPSTTNYDTPGSHTIPVPLGASQLVLIVTGGGSGGQPGNGSGGAAGTAQRTIPIVAADWSTSLSIVIGSGGAVSISDNRGTNSTVSITVAAGSFSLAGNAATLSGTVGGTATGGTTNTSGANGTSGAGTNTGGASFWAAGGTGTSLGTLGSGGGSTSVSGGLGGNGRIQVAWT